MTMTMRHRVLVALTVAAAAAALAGCWASSKDTSLTVAPAGPPAGASAVGIDKCYNCHSGTAVNGRSIFEDWASSRHANLDNTSDAYDNSIGNTKPYHGILPYSGYEPEPDEECAVCHNPTQDNVNLARYTGPGSSATTPRWVVGCEACHGGGSLHYGVGPIGGPKAGYYAVAASPGQSSQYNTCTSCHGDSEHRSKLYRLIGDTHYDNATRAVGSDIQGYVIRKAADTACVDCHNPHTVDLAINRQWKASGHGDFAGEAWKHYQWTQPSRQACQRCHTTTGLVNYLTDPANYDPAKNTFAWLTSPATDNRAEMLYCYGCHTNYYGGLRDPGPITASYTGVTPEPVFPDVKGSNICMACHTGRENGDSIKASTADFSNTSFINSHYLTAGATVFGVSGYEYDGLNYANPAYYKHDKIGSSSAPGTGSNGPCVGCHMTSTQDNATSYGSHRFLPIREEGGVITAITTPVCGTCHTGGYALTPTKLEEEKEEAQNALAALDNQLRAKGFYFANTYPYFFKTADNTAAGNAVKNWSKGGDNTVGKNNMGAAFNYNLFYHEPGFYAHNRYYAKRLLYDSIDWLDNGAFDNSVQTTLGALSPAFDNALAYFGASGRP